MTGDTRPVMVAAGGTGGHIYPALVVAAELRRRGLSLLWLGNADGMEARLSKQHGYQFLPLRALPIRGKGVLAKIMALGFLLYSVLRAMCYFRKYKPALLLGMGGYASAAGGVAAWLWRVPLCLHEQNAIPGMTNRWLAPLATVVMEAYQGSFPVGRKAMHTGNPVRSELVAPATRGKGGTPGRILLLGGSQGSVVLNKVMPQAWQIIRQRMELRLRHQSGANWCSEVSAAYGSDSAVQVCGYIDDMAAALAEADLVVCRAGAMTLAEASAVGLPAVIVPYRLAADDHQNANAACMVAANAAEVIPELDCSPQLLADVLLRLLGKPEQLAVMAVASSNLAKADAASLMADLCLEAARG